jgi:glucose/arabinose dehydrogenase
MIIVGNAAANVLRGTLAPDRMSGLGGHDRLFGASGSDAIFAGPGNDRVAGGEGADRLVGGDGNDVIFGFGFADRTAASASITVTGVGQPTFSRPVFATSAPGSPDRLYVVEQHTGRVRILDTLTGATNPTPFLDLPDASLAQGNEQGLLGLAFDPDYAVNGRLFVYLTQADGDIELRSYQRSASNPNIVDAGSGNALLVIDRDNGARNHNGGWIGFGPDGMLYAAVGDEGLAGDPANNAQNVNSLWGKLLRIDVDGDDFPGDVNRDYAIPADNPFAGRAGADEVWALGLRNPWRGSFDRRTGDLYIGDVGQSAREEIDFQRAGSAGGANYGWKVKEGEIVFDDSVAGNPPPDSPLLTDPMATYGHDAAGGFAVVGGYVYRGASGGMFGRYLYADFVSEQLWSLRVVGNRAIDVTNHTSQLVSDGGSLAGITSFAEDGRGNLYAISVGGTVSRLTFGSASGDTGDTIGGGAGDDRLFGGAGRDTIFGGAGRDTIDGGEGRDVIAGGGLGDVLRGGWAADRISGAGGFDYLDGGAGRDVLSGGAGADTFFFGPGSTADTVTDFEDNIDLIRLGEGFRFTSAAQALGFADAVGDDVVFTFAGGQSLTLLGTNVAALTNDLIV